MSVIDFKAAQKWAKVPKNFQEELIRNVFCSSCFETTITDYHCMMTNLVLYLKGNVKNVVRM